MTRNCDYKANQEITGLLVYFLNRLATYNWRVLSSEFGMHI